MRFFTYLKVLFKNRKKYRRMIHKDIMNTPEMNAFKYIKLLQQDFSYKLNYKPKKPPTIKEMKKFLDID